VSRLYAAGMDWWEYAEPLLNSLGRETVAARMGMDPSAFSRWKKKPTSVPPAETVVSFARVVGDSPVALLVRFGYLRPSEAKEIVELPASVRDLPADDLLLELARRLGVGLSREGRRGA
jgi:transcriptional regulator with XRE-family HTH domain